MTNEAGRLSKVVVIERINVLEKELMHCFDPVIARQQARLDNPDDSLIDWEVEASILAVDNNGDKMGFSTWFHHHPLGDSIMLV